MSKQSFRSNGKGYYIALILCAAAIGISGYMYYQSVNQTDPQMNEPNVTVAATEPSGQDVPAVATQPSPTAGTTAPTETQQKKTLQTVSPVDGQVVAVYAMDSLSYNTTTRDWRVHNGVDIAAEAGTAVFAAADGQVYTVYEDETMGMTVVIQHEDGYITKYSSLAQEVCVAPGDQVTMGQTIGYVGATALLETAIGDHLHFSVTCNGEPMDPEAFLKGAE